jgi:hypothetical protein
MHLPHMEALTSIRGHSQRKLPPAIENFWARAKEPNRVIPPLDDREAIGDFAIAARKLHGHRPIPDPSIRGVG